MSARAEMSASAPRRQHERRREGRWRRSCTRGVVMMRFALVLMALVLLGTATEAPAACRRFGTQLECDLGGEPPPEFILRQRRSPPFSHARAPLCPEEILQDGDSCWRAGKGKCAVRRSGEALAVGRNSR